MPKAVVRCPFLIFDYNLRTMLGRGMTSTEVRYFIVPVGEYKVRLENSPTGLDEIRPVQVSMGQTQNILIAPPSPAQPGEGGGEGAAPALGFSRSNTMQRKGLWGGVILLAALWASASGAATSPLKATIIDRYGNQHQVNKFTFKGVRIWKSTSKASVGWWNWSRSLGCALKGSAATRNSASCSCSGTAAKNRA